MNDPEMKNDKRQAVCDLTFLKESYMGNIPMMLEVLDLFLEQLPDQLHDLKQAVNHSSFSMIEFSAHRMKSTLMIVGLKGLDAELKEMETLGKNEEKPERISLLFERIYEICGSALDEIKQERTNLVEQMKN